MIFPTDSQSVSTLFDNLIAHERAQSQIIQALTEILKEAMQDVDLQNNGLDPQWYDEAEKILNIQDQIRIKNETRTFNEKNDYGAPANTPHVQFNPEQNVAANEIEKSMGEMTEEDLARHFKLTSNPALMEPTTLKNMSEQEINRTPVEELKKLVEQAEKDEANQDNSSDLYKIKSRVQNLAVSISGGNLTPVGEMMVNSFVHVVKDLYDFADSLTDERVRVKLYRCIRKHESMPGTLISAASVGVKVKK